MKKNLNKKHIRTTQYRENLFTLLDENYERHFRNKPFWRDLQLLDNEITPDCIKLETFKGDPAKHLRSSDDTSDDFTVGEKTLVFRCKSKEGAINGSKLLSKIFDGSGTKFVPEIPIDNDHEIYQIRTNLDKRHWEKLCVFCTYRFEREITDVNERTKIQAHAQKLLDEYVKGTPSEGWEATEGIPAFCAVMGLHGNLRPPLDSRTHYHANTHQIEQDLNEPHPRGTPLLFQGILMHADIKRGGEITCTTPYNIMFNENRAALLEASDGKPYIQLLSETCGGYPFERGMALSRRAIATIGLLLGSYGLFHAGQDFLGIVGPATSVAAGGAFFIFTYFDHKWKFVDRLSAIKKNGENGHTVTYLKSQATGKTITLEDDEVGQNINDGYTREGGYINEMQNSRDATLANEALSAKGQRQIIDAIIEIGSKPTFAAVHEARVTQAAKDVLAK